MILFLSALIIEIFVSNNFYSPKKSHVFVSLAHLSSRKMCKQRKFDINHNLKNLSY